MKKINKRKLKEKKQKKKKLKDKNKRKKRKKKKNDKKLFSMIKEQKKFIFLKECLKYKIIKLNYLFKMWMIKNFKKKENVLFLVNKDLNLN